jgi:hypothetical protein
VTYVIAFTSRCYSCYEIALSFSSYLLAELSLEPVSSVRLDTLIFGLVAVEIHEQLNSILRRFVGLLFELFRRVNMLAHSCKLCFPGSRSFQRIDAFLKGRKLLFQLCFFVQFLNQRREN